MSGLDSVGKCEEGLQEGALWHAAKRSFGDMRSQAEAWDRGNERRGDSADSRLPLAGGRAFRQSFRPGLTTRLVDLPSGIFDIDLTLDPRQWYTLTHNPYRL